MRLIEKEMLEAIKHGRDWYKDNTCVVTGQYWQITEVDASYRSYFADIYLHGNHIAEVVCRMGMDDLVVKPNVDTLLKYPTRTTMSRLRALGVDVCTRKGEVLLNGREI